MRSKFVVALVLVAALSFLVAPARASSVVIDHMTHGTVFDGLLDGFPNLFGARDGNADLAGNPLSVVRKGDVTEIRTAMEFPLATIAPSAADVVSATLTFNVDDVLSTLGPGTELNGQAADTILVHTYAGEGAINLNDFARTGEAATAVDTGPGSITDATLSQTGAVFFHVDVTARLRQALDAGTPFLGSLWRTTDSPTGTSLDDGRGGSQSGEPSQTSAGSHLPFLTVELNDAPPPGCGNGTPDAGEQCDDGNNTDGDCCSRLCTLDAVGTTCTDGDACTTGDTCDGAGMCRPGGPTSCDDANVCTSDACEPAIGCVHMPANEGLGCDDGSTCTANDVCHTSVCAGTPVTGSCDDVDACTSGDTCSDGVCGGVPLCGNGVVDAACDEECDDGNTTGVDGCSASCRYDAILGGTSPRECLLRIALGAPVRAADGSLPDVQECTDGDPACDGDPAAGSCGFVVAACLGMPDPRLPGCELAPSVSPSVARPGRNAREKQNRSRLDAALAATVVPGCSAPVQLAVPVRKKGKKVRPGKARLVLRAKSPGAGRDRDVVTLVCNPGS